MRAYDLIHATREGIPLTTDQIAWLVRGFVAGEVLDAQMSAWLMAVCCRGLTPRETADLTMSMVRSGETLDLSGIRGVKVDKHSTGGVGDKTSLVLVPLVAAAGAPVAKLSGRGLGHTGGTLDKLEAIPGFDVSLSPEAFVAQVNAVGCAIAGQTADLVPADKRLYALRDVTATIESVALIASSVMSKKIAAGADAVVLDVKTGSGAFMKTPEASRALAEAMVRIGVDVGRRTVAVISDMDQPLGLAVGNALEVREAIETLHGGGPRDVRDLCLGLGAEMLVLSGVAHEPGDATARLAAALDGGAALRKFAEMVRAQRGDPRVTEDLSLLPACPIRVPVPAPRPGVVQAINAEEIGLAAMRLGAGRARAGEAIDPAVGVVLRRKIGDPVSAGTPLAEIHARDEVRAAEAVASVEAAYRIGEAAAAPAPLVRAVVRG